MNFRADRTKWVAGQWDNEPDRVDFEYAGLRCEVLRGPMGSFNGYVSVPERHPAYGIDYMNFEHPVSNLDVHGGITYSGTHEDGKSWTFGFDTAHYLDLTPLDMSLVVRGIIDNKYGEYRNLQYVVEETVKLARQLSELELSIKEVK